MLFNCTSCGKTISTQIEKCPYCKINISELSERFSGTFTRETRTNRENKLLKHSLVSFFKPKLS